MTFFARPDLSNEQFRQLSGSNLTLSGTTQIASVSGLSLTNGANTFVPITLNGAAPGVTDYWSLAYDPVDGVVKLQDISGGGGVGAYLGISPTSVTVGGLSANTAIFGSGFTQILQTILTPAVNPTIINQSQTFTISPTTTIFEVGESFNATGLTRFCSGAVAPVYNSLGNIIGTSGARSGLPFQYVYGGSLQAQSLSQSVFNTTATTHTHTISSVIINSGVNNWTSSVRFHSGSTIFNSRGGVFLTGLTSGFTFSNIQINGIFPYYWGRWRTTTTTPSGANRPSEGQIVQCINQLNTLRATTQPNATVWNANGSTTCIVVASGSDTITVNYNSRAEDYLWLAIFAADSIKYSWFVNELNRGLICGVVSPGGQLFPAYIEEICGIQSAKWELAANVSGGQPYSIYISNYQTRLESPIEFRS